MDVKSWIEKTGIDTSENRALKPPGYPYIIIDVEESTRGDDITNAGILEQTVTLELYSDKLNALAEKKVEIAFDEIERDYAKRRRWIDDQKLYMTNYSFLVVEKVR